MVLEVADLNLHFLKLPEYGNGIFPLAFFLLT